MEEVEEDDDSKFEKSRRAINTQSRQQMVYMFLMEWIICIWLSYIISWCVGICGYGLWYE